MNKAYYRRIQGAWPLNRQLPCMKGCKAHWPEHAVKAISYTILLHRRKDRDTLRLMQSVVNNVSEAGPLPFELRVLEALLDETARHFERRQRRLELLALSIEEDIQKTLRQDAADLQRLLPIQRCTTLFISQVMCIQKVTAGMHLHCCLML